MKIGQKHSKRNMNQLIIDKKPKHGEKNIKVKSALPFLTVLVIICLSKLQSRA